MTTLFIFVAALFIVIKGATMSTTYASRLAESYHLSKYTVGFIIIAIISILPETFIAINASIKGIPSFGLGMLFGSNITDMTLVIAAIVFLAGRGIKIESKIIKNHTIYPLLLLLPLVLGIDGGFTRLDGVALLITGAAFYYMALKNGSDNKISLHKAKGRFKNLALLLLSMLILLVGSYFTVTSATTLASSIGVSSVLIGMLVVGLGTTMPEFFFALNSVKKNDDSLAVGDILGTVLADATIVIGLLALIHPFNFPQRIIYITGIFMVVAAFLLFRFMRSGHTLTKKEAFLLMGFWLIFVLVEVSTSL